MSISPSATHEEDDKDEIYPIIAGVAAAYGDKDGAYLDFVKKSRPEFMSDPYIFWNQPWGMNEVSGKSSTSITRGDKKNRLVFPDESSEFALGRIEIDDSDAGLLDRISLSRLDVLDWLRVRRVTL